VPLEAREAAAEGGDDQTVARPPADPLRLPPQHALLVPQREQLDVARRARVGTEDKEVKEHTHEARDNEEHHRVSVPAPVGPLACICAPHSLTLHGRSSCALQVITDDDLVGAGGERRGAGRLDQGPARPRVALTGLPALVLPGALIAALSS
jgi:hypothetical protein